MKLRCPRCDAKISAPDEWVGRMIRCKACNKAFAVPRPTASIAPTRADAGLDMEDLANLERSSMEMGQAEAAEAEKHRRAAETQSAPPPPGVRTCPNCQKQVKVKDVYSEVICSNCWQPIPALAGGESHATRDFADGLTVRYMRPTGFYAGLAGVFTYPFGALTSLLISVGVAIGVILLPVSVVVAIARTVEQGTIGLAESQGPAYLTGVRYGVLGCFYLQVLFFAGVGVHAFLEVIGTTTTGQEKPPGLIWNPTNWGNSIIAYFTLIVYYAACSLIVLLIAGGGELHLPRTAEDFSALLRPWVIMIAALFTFFVPMNLIGMAVENIWRGLNPVSVVKSIINTNVHYVFMFLLVGTYVTIYVTAFAAVLAWFSGSVDRLGEAAGAGDILAVAGGLLSWGIVMGVGFYGTYLLGRVFGLFARSFRSRLAF